MTDSDIHQSPEANADSSESVHWPVDVQRTDATGEVDLAQLEYNLSLTPLQRIEQNDAWVKFIHIARRAGQKLNSERPTNRAPR
ncbi:MAG: hypothetical protein JO353_10120 [Phycisphaerae bacterium]|nr:hypothetical protein [Phycisphaerae bacterium]